MDNDNSIKRSELHIHTVFSENQRSSIEVEDAIERAKELGLSSIAFCDYRSVDAYSEIMKIDDKSWSDMKIIYGAELSFETTTQTYKTRGYSLTLLAKNKVNKYTEILKTRLEIETITGDLISKTDLISIGCKLNVYAVNCDNSIYVSWIYNKQSYFTKTIYFLYPMHFSSIILVSHF